MRDSEDLDVLSVTTTVGSLEAARDLAREILGSGLAACVQIDPAVISLYHWKGDLCDEPEVRLVIKTTPACESGLLALFALRHPYELPQFLVTPMRGSAAYGAWVREETAKPPG
jgi:periplasmic divalent cation tolerance protein